MSAVAPWLMPTLAVLTERLEQGQLGHALLIQGQAGLGQDQLAVAVAEAVVGQPALMAAGTHPDYFVVKVDEEAHSSILIDQIRALSNSLTLTSARGGRRAAVVFEAHRMTDGASNALLKTLEEPPAGVWLVLVTDQPDRLLPTIRSRCQSIVLRTPPLADGLEWLQAQCPQQDHALLSQALALSSGAPLAALELVQSDGLSVGLAIRDDLQAFSQGAVLHPDLLSRWTADAEATWRWLAMWMADLTQTSGGHGWQVTPVATTLHRLWDEALRGQRGSQRSFRQDLAFQRWILLWQQACIKVK